MQLQLKPLNHQPGSLEHQSVMGATGIFSFENFSNKFLKTSKRERNESDYDKVNFTIILEDYVLYEFENVIMDKLCILYDEHYIPIRESLNTYDDIDNFVEESGIKNFTNVKEINLEKAPILFFDHYFYNFTHFVFEAFPRLFAVKDLLKKGHKILLPSKLNPQNKGYDYYQHIQPCLDSIGITAEDIIEIPEGGAKFTNLIMPSHIKFRPDYVLPAIEHLKNHYFDPTFEWPYLHLYISREDTKIRNITNKKQVEMVLCKYFGFKKIVMSDYSFKEKVNIMMRAQHVVSVDSSSLTNAMFMEKGSKVLALRSFDFFFYGIPFMSLFNHDIYFQVCEFSTHDKSHYSGHLFVNIVRLFDNICAIKNDSSKKCCKENMYCFLFRLHLSMCHLAGNSLNELKLFYYNIRFSPKLNKIKKLIGLLRS